MTLREPRFPLRLRAMLFPSISPSHCFHDSPIYGSRSFNSFIIDTNADEQIAAILTEARERTEEAEAGSISAKASSKLALSEVNKDTNPILQVILLASRIFLAALHSHSPKGIFASPFFGAYIELISKNLDATRSHEFVIYIPFCSFPPQQLTATSISGLQIREFACGSSSLVLLVPYIGRKEVTI